jgi:hypothetical protein
LSEQAHSSHTWKKRKETIMKLANRIGAIILMCTACVSGTAMLEGCKELTPQQESVLTKASATILCAMEGEMLDDPALNKACEEILPNLAPEQRAAVQAHITAHKAMKTKPFADAGASEGGK